MREYKLSKFWRVVTHVCCLVPLGLSAFLFYFPYTEEFKLVHILFYVLGCGFLFLSIYGIIDAIRGKLIIDESQILLVNPFGERTIPLEEVDGYRVTENYFVVEPADKKKFKKIKISTYLSPRSEIEEFLLNTFPNLDDEEKLAEEEQILSNDEFGITEETRAARLEHARKVAKYANYLSWGIMIWIVFYPRPYNLAVAAGIIYPVLALLICYLYRGWMKGGDNDKSAYPSMAESFILPSIALTLRATLDANVINYAAGWPLIILLTAGCFVLYQIPTGGFRPGKTSDYIFLILFPLFTFCYAYGTVTLINWKADKSQAEIYETTIADKRVDDGKVKTYHLVLKPWNDLTENEDVKVNYEDFQQVNINDNVTIHQYKGYFGMPWIEVEF
jgi:hypothetical protein